MFMHVSGCIAGTGYFTLPYLVHTRATHVYACEWLYCRNWLLHIALPGSHQGNSCLCMWVAVLQELVTSHCPTRAYLVHTRTAHVYACEWLYCRNWLLHIALPGSCWGSSCLCMWVESCCCRGAHDKSCSQQSLWSMHRSLRWQQTGTAFILIIWLSFKNKDSVPLRQFLII